MFTLTDTPVKFVGLLILFTFSTIWSLYQLARRQNAPTLVSNLAHLAMAVVMLLMVPRALWQPFVAVIPLPVLVGFFGLVAVWFGYLGVRGVAAGGALRQHGWHAWGHAGMFGAMTWHLAAMLSHRMAGAGHQAPTDAGSGQSAMGHGSMGHGSMGHGSMGHGPMGQGEVGHSSMAQHVTASDPMPLQAGMPGDTAMLLAIIGIPFMTYLLAAAAWNLKSAVSPSAMIRDQAGHAAAGHGHYAAGSPRLAALADFAMNFGMFWMSTGLMVALLPFFRYLSF